MAKKTDRDTFARKLCLLDLLPDGTRPPLPVLDLQKALEEEGFSVGIRTIERDLNELASFGRFQLRRSPGKPAGWSWQPHRKPALHQVMTAETALMYSLLERFLALLLPRSLFDQLIPTFVEARQKLASSSEGRLAAWNRRVVIDQVSQPLLLPEIGPQVQRVISEALLKSRQCEFDYRSPNHAEGAPLKRARVSPAGIVLREGLQYLVCTFEGGKHLYTYALHRMSSPKLLDARASIPPDFDLERHVIQQQAIGIPNGESIALELRVSGWWSGFLAERRLSEDQVILAIRGSADKRIIATVANTEQLRWWLLSLGSSVGVLKPAALRERVTEEITAMARRYRQRDQ